MAEKIQILQRKKVIYNDSDTDSDEDEEPMIRSFEKLNLGRTKKLLVLSLNGLILHRVYAPRYATSVPGLRVPDGRYGKHFVFKRPFIDEFVKFCFEKFEIGIWSSALEHNIEGVLECTMKGFTDRLMFVWDQQECTNTGFMSLEKQDKPLFFKDLKKLWENADRSLLWQKGKYSASNTLMIDDTPYKTLLNPPNTAIFPEAYDVQNVNDNALDPNGQLGQFLDGLADAEDVQTYVEQHPFGQPPVTSSHPNWAYYSMVLSRLTRK